MKNSILFILFLILTFVLNIGFYYVSSDYRDFLKSIKTEEKVVDLEEEIENDIESNSPKLEDDSISKVNVNNKQEEIFDDEINVKLKTQVVLGKNYEKILDIFDTYKLAKLELNTNLFDLTDEYPDNYIEYYSAGLTLYLFPTRNYNEVYDIFDILKFELPYEINEINNFGDRSFYLNLDSDIDDGFVRIVIENDGIVFGLKINKNEYNLVKEKLELLKNN